MTVKLSADKIERARIALGAVAPVAIRTTETETMLKGKTLSEEVIKEAASMATGESSPIDDFRSGAEYRRNMVARLVEKGLHKIAAE